MRILLLCDFDSFLLSFYPPSPFSCCLQFSNIFHFWPFHQETQKETINERRPRQGWPTDAKHRLYYPLSPFLSFPLLPCLPLSPYHDSFWPIGNFVISHALCASLMFITHKWTHIDWYFTSSGGLLALSLSLAHCNSLVLLSLSLSLSVSLARFAVDVFAVCNKCVLFSLLAWLFFIFYLFIYIARKGCPPRRPLSPACSLI